MLLRRDNIDRSHNLALTELFFRLILQVGSFLYKWIYQISEVLSTNHIFFQRNLRVMFFQLYNYKYVFAELLPFDVCLAG
jgi:hypothetical protein